MERPELHQEISQILDKLVKRNRSLMTEGGEIASLDVEMLRKLSIELYDLVLSLSEVNSVAKSQDFKVKVENILAVNTILEEEMLPEEKVLVQPEIELPQEIVESPVIELPTEPEIPLEVKNEKIIEVPEIETEVKLAPIAKIKFPQEIEPEFENTFKTAPPAPSIIETIISEDNGLPEIENEVPKAKQETAPIEMKTGSIQDLAAKNFVSIEEKVVHNHKPIHKPISTDKSVLDRLSENEVKTTVHDVTKTSKTEKVLSESFLNFKISRIVDAIDISKRFELQNNLFGRDPQVYLNAIQTLEKSQNLNEAMAHFSTFGKNYHWDFKDELVEELKSFIHRKYQE